MHFFLFDFALAFVALLGYRAMAAVAQDRGPAVTLKGSPHPLPGGNPGVTGAQRTGQEAVLKEPLVPDDPSCGQSVGGRITRGERPPDQPINFW